MFSSLPLSGFAGQQTALSARDDPTLCWFGFFLRCPMPARTHGKRSREVKGQRPPPRVTQYVLTPRVITIYWRRLVRGNRAWRYILSVVTTQCGAWQHQLSYGLVGHDLNVLFVR